MIRRANKIAIYFLNKDKKWDLDNYLYQKWLSPFDLVRTFWYLLTIKTGYADTYRNEQYLPKTDIWYNHERKMHGINLGNPDALRTATNLVVCLGEELETVKAWL